MSTAAWPITRFQLDLGDRMPNISGPDQHQSRFSTLAAPPGPFAILSIPAGQGAAADAALAAFDRVVQDDGGAKPNPVISMSGSAEEVHGKARSLAIKTSVLADTRGQLDRPFRAPRDGLTDAPCERDGIIAVLTDPDQTIRSVIPFTTGEGFAAALAEALARLERPGERAGEAGFAPVLRVPHLLSPAQCQALIAAWETSHEPGMEGFTGHYGEAVDQRTANRVCYDHPLKDGALKTQLLSTIAPRIREAVSKAFQFDVRYYGGIMVVGYLADEGGFFGSHRDNTNPALMHRRFALSVNLNTGAYQGGGVWFPEFADRVYDPPLGDGLLFSCSLLHEARVVTRGTRFILSAFMWGEAEEQLRQRILHQAAERRQRHARNV